MSQPRIADCWNRIGVQGDKSCPDLPPYIHCRNCPTFRRGAQALLERPSPEGYLEEWTRLLAREKETQAGFTDAAMVFRIGAEWLALRARCCVEVVSMRPIRRVPHRSGRMLLGVASVRGELLLCFSLAQLLGLEPEAEAADAAARPRLLVARQDRWTLAFPVTEVGGLHRYHQDAVAALPATVAHAVPQFTRGLLPMEGRQAGLLDDELIFHAMAKALAGME